MHNKQRLIELCKTRLGLEETIFEKKKIEDLSNFLEISLDKLCQTLDKIFTWNDCNEVIQYSALLVQGACVNYLGSQALINRGREYSTSDGYGSAKVSEILQRQYEIEFADYSKELEKLVPKLQQVVPNFIPVPLNDFGNGLWPPYTINNNYKDGLLTTTSGSAGYAPPSSDTKFMYNPYSNIT